jgi:hypothetical protein
VHNEACATASAGEHKKAQESDRCAMSELTKLQKIELKALVLDKQAILELVSCVREMRSVTKKLLGSRYRDGECDAVTLTTFAQRMDAIEDLEHETCISD